MFYCLLCHGACPPQKDVCQPCYQDLPWNLHCCGRCAEPLLATDIDAEGLCSRCLEVEPNFDSCFAPFRYQFPIDQLMLHGKGGKRPELLRPLSRWLAEHIRLNSHQKPDLLVPIPLHPSKQLHRGYNQAGLIAHMLGQALSIPVNHGLIKKVREPAQQKSLSKEARENNLRRSFRIERRTLRSHSPPIHHIALIDDIVTTGSTINQLARQLRSSGVEQVDAWAIARTPRKY